MTEPLPDPPPRLVLRVLSGLMLIAVTISGLFWLGYGVVDGFAIGFTGFLVVLAGAVEYLPALTDWIATEQIADRAVVRLARQSP